MKRTTLFTALVFVALLANTQTNVIPDITLTTFATGFSSPVGIEHAGDSRLFVVEQTGKIRIVGTNGKHKSHFLNLSDKITTTGFEQGLLGMAFDPDYEDNGYFYVHYTNLEGNNQFSRFRVNPHNPNKALPSSEVKFLEDDDPFANHNSGQMKFGPDGYLYFALGDGGSGGDPFNNAQDLSTIMGKLMRVDPNPNGSYSIPADNPYVGVEGAMEEIWASGLRNPWRFSFDRETGDLWIPDVGQNLWEEVNMTPAGTPGGVNYGWSCREGFVQFKADCDANGEPFTDPIAVYAHDESEEFFCSGSITGGYVYRGDQYPDMYGKYFYADFCTGHLYTTYEYDDEWVTVDLGAYTPFAYSTFGEDIQGEMYIADKTSGVIYRFTDGNEEAFAIQPPTVDPIAGVALEYELSPNPNRGDFSFEFAADADATYQATILDFTGRKILDESREVYTGENEWTFDNLNLNPGYYMLRLQMPSGITVVNFVAE
jgi:glucose/arabinose dehydrogenase